MVSEIKNRLGFASSILKAITLPCLVVDTEDRVTFVNPPLSRLLGAGGDYKSLLGRDAAAVFGENTALSSQLTDCLRDHTCRLGVEAVLDDGQGLSRQVRLDTAPLYDLDEGLIGAFALVVDLTDIKDQEALIVSRNDMISFDPLVDGRRGKEKIYLQGHCICAIDPDDENSGFSDGLCHLFLQHILHRRVAGGGLCGQPGAECPVVGRWARGPNGLGAIFCGARPGE